MYSTCLFCNKSLGANEVLESFPVGRRLAFDGAKGRLWVVCRHCERWNLSPLEERWEVIEACEELFRGTRLRTSTEHIGLARLREGLELVRIGEPLRPELAAWRYGDQFGRRRRRLWVRVGVAAGGFLLLNVGGAAAGLAMGSFAGVFASSFSNYVTGDPEAVVARLRLQDGRVLPVKRRRLKSVNLFEGPGGVLSLQLPEGKKDRFVVTGEEARRALALLLPAVNHAGASARRVQSAVGVLERAGDPEAVLEYAARHATATHAEKLGSLPAELRLGLEMASHEDAERRALEGELSALEQEWRRAEELAGISDQLLVPGEIDQRLDELRKRS